MINKSKNKNKNKSKNKSKNRFGSNLCDDNMTFQECELVILRNAIDEGDRVKGQRLIENDDVKRIIKVVENFLRDKSLICYGGTAINNILPKNAQFYNFGSEIPDYDFYSMNAMDDAVELADIYYKNGFTNVEAKAGIHYGTYKVFVNYIAVADITYLNPVIFKQIKKEEIIISGISYAPPNFLRMAMYLELSRPAGDTSRWEKVLKRLVLLNKYYPLKTKKNCNTVDFQRKIENVELDSEKLYYIIRDALIDQDVVFFGGYAAKLYSKHMKNDDKNQIEKIPDFDVITDEPEMTATILKEQLRSNGYNDIRTKIRPAIGEIIPMCLEISSGNETLAFLYKPIACHNYNSIYIDGKKINIATIDTMLSFYLAFYYSNEPYHYKDRILCMSKYLFDVEQKNRLAQNGVLRRFSLKCQGKQETMETILAEKTAKFEELKFKRNSREYKEWFLRYNPEREKKTKNKTKRKIYNKNNTKKVRQSSKTSNEFILDKYRL
jgi:hypothetical protein